MRLGLWLVGLMFMWCGSELVAADAAVSPLETALMREVVRARKEQGKSSLTMRTGLCDLAREHSAKMARGEIRLGHSGFDRRMAKARAWWPRLEAMGENVGYLPEASPEAMAKEMVQRWIKSPPHRKNLFGDFSNAGVGFISIGGNSFATLLLMRERPATSQTPEASPTAWLDLMEGSRR